MHACAKLSHLVKMYRFAKLPLRRFMLFRIAIPLAITFFVFSPMGLFAVIDLSIVHPRTDFTTNNQALSIEGIVESSIPTKVVVTTNTPAGVPDLEQLAHSLHAIILDLGSSRQLKAALISPYADLDLSFGPRMVQMAFAQDDTNFPEGHRLNVPSSIGTSFNKTVVDFPGIISAQFVQIVMLEGWQRERIAIESVEFLDSNNQIIQAGIQSISILLDLSVENRAPFSVQVLLKTGENRLTLFARTLVLPGANQIETADWVTISPFYLSELRPDAADAGYYTLSDGHRAQIVLAVDAFDEKIKKLQFYSVPREQFDSLSYSENEQIVEGTAPAVVYRFEALKQGVFAAEASNSLRDQPPTLAFDGILDFPSTWVAGLVPLPISLTADLGEVRAISRIVVHANVTENGSFGPQSAIIFTSNDNVNFTELFEYSGFDDRTTAIELPSHPSARYVRLKITESKQANNVQINEVELFDVSDSKLVPLVAVDRFLLQRPAHLELSYTASDLLAANIRRESDLRIFAWDDLGKEWQLVGGEIDLDRQTVSLELNYISEFALFQAVTSKIQTAWSLNPFSPDGNGIADVTRLTIINADTSPFRRNELIVEIFDLNNRLVRTLVNRTVMHSNAMSIEWDGRDGTGRIVNIGPYIYQIQIQSDMQTDVRNGVIVVGK